MKFRGDSSTALSPTTPQETHLNTQSKKQEGGLGKVSPQ